MSSHTKRTRAARASADQAELAGMLQGAGTVPKTEAVVFTLDELSAAVRHWGDDPADREAAKVGGGFGPKACVAIEVLTEMTLAREQKVACAADSDLAHVISAALRMNKIPPNALPSDAHA